MNLAIQNLPQIQLTGAEVPAPEIFMLPEKVLQFGTGVLLRALPDYFIDKANRKNIFNGRIVVVKSTETGETTSFDRQNGLYTLAVRGLEDGLPVDRSVICSSISRVLSARTQWTAILECAANRELKIIISNTTEVGIQLIKESVFLDPPVSFPAKLLAFLVERFKALHGTPESGLVIIPTELLTDNGKKLKAIVTELALFNKLEESFIKWLDLHNYFCSSLVDRIVPGKPDDSTKLELEERWEYTDDIMLVCEPYRLWAIEGDESIRKILSFCATDSGVVITPDITRYKELKLRMLNATHTLSSGLACLSGFQTVKEAMEDGLFASYMTNLMMDEIGRAIPYDIPESEIRAFGNQVLDRFRNPYLQHQWLSITMQYSSKIATRVLPVLYTYYLHFKKAPALISMGFAAFILFMRPVKKEGTKYYGMLNSQYYLINDDRAAYFYGIWEESSVDIIVQKILSDPECWSDDLTRLEGFATAVTRKLKRLIRSGILPEIAAYSKSEE
jgi:tagaturonate reductase